MLVQLSEGKEVTLDCTAGETIFNIKKTLLDQHEVPFESTVFFNDKHVVDPLSLNDIEGFLENPVLRVRSSNSSIVPPRLNHSTQAPPLHLIMLWRLLLSWK